MLDTWGDGWGGPIYTITNSNGAIVISGTLEDGSSDTDEVCGLPWDCYTMTVPPGGGFESEIHWRIVQGGMLQAEAEDTARDQH